MFCVHPPRPSRLPGFSYVGHHRYFLTICALRGAVELTSPSVASSLLLQLRQHVEAEAFALLAYCVMKDHVHLVVEGLSEMSDLRRLVSRWKQATGYRFKQETRHGLWMTGYYDRVLRDGESTIDAVFYVLRNPVRAGLAAKIGDYGYAGSDVFSRQELDEVLGGRLL
jgi:putative transposase